MIQAFMLLWVGTIAFIATGAGVFLSERDARRGEGGLPAIIVNSLSLVFWALFTLHSTNYMQSLGSGVAQSANTPSFMVLGLIGGAIAVLLTIDAVFRVLR